MTVYAIGDLHLPGGLDKPMAVFGAHWEGHFDKIAADWRARVTDEDIVLLPGDTSWAMRLEDAAGDLAAIGALPGTKILLRGNHDYWWSSLSRVRAMLPKGMYALQNDALKLGGAVFCGSRGWTLPQSAGDAENTRLYERELQRLKLSLDCAVRKRAPGDVLIVLTHYPPLGEGAAETPVSAMLRAYGVDCAVYGHLHGASLRGASTGEVGGVAYHCVSCDGLGFRLREIARVVEDAAP